MSLIDTFSPPIEVVLVTGETVHFKRLLMDDWASFCQQLDNERYEEAVKIVNADRKIDNAERIIALRRAKDEKSDLYEVMHRFVRTVDGIRKILAFSLVEKDLADRLAVLEPTVITYVVDEIVHRPILPKEKVLPLESSGGTNAASETSGTGNSAQSGSAESSAKTPETLPSDNSLTTTTA